MNATTKNTAAMSEPNSNSHSMSPDLLHVDVQFAAELKVGEERPLATSIIEWARLAFAEQSKKVNVFQSAELGVRIISESEMSSLNQVYRGKSGPTNVLSFDAQLPKEVSEDFEVVLLGDIVICHSVVTTQAEQQGKSVNNHYAHMVAHGVLHLCGYDHEDEVSAREMESLEIKILHALGIQDPYC